MTVAVIVHPYFDRKYVFDKGMLERRGTDPYIRAIQWFVSSTDKHLIVLEEHDYVSRTRGLFASYGRTGDIDFIETDWINPEPLRGWHELDFHPRISHTPFISLAGGYYWPDREQLGYLGAAKKHLEESGRTVELLPGLVFR